MNIAVFYHAYLPDASSERVLLEQVSALRQSGLEAAANELVVGLSGDPWGAEVLRALLPRARIESFPENDRGEAATIQQLQLWLPTHPDWAVCYHHTKGVTHGEGPYAEWRRCLERNVIWSWLRCVNRLRRGFETVGAHWHLNQDQQYWAGNFWWANSNYLSLLPPVDTKVVNGRSYESEVWIGKCGRSPRITDYAGHPLMSGCVQENSRH